MNGTMKTTGETQIQIVLGTLLETVYDKNNAVFETINTSLRKIAKKHPNAMLKSCCAFGGCVEPKPSNEHLGIVLELMEDICKEHIIYVDGDTLLLVIAFCLQLMTHSASYEPITQMPASGVLVAIGTRHGIQIVDGLLSKMSAGIVPHYTIPHTLGALASTNAYGVVPQLKIILGIMLPLLGALKQDAVKQSFVYALGCFCDAIVEYTTNPEQAPDPTIRVAHFQAEMAMAFDVLFTVWLHSKEAKLVESVLDALAAMFNIIGEEKVRQHTSKCVHTLLALYRRHKESQAITKCMGAVIAVASQTDGTLIEPQLSQVLHALADHICIAPDYAQPDSLRTHSEALRCYECLAAHFTDHTMEHIVALLKHPSEKERCKGLSILTHLTNAVDAAIRHRLNDALVVMQLMMINESGVKVKRTLIKLIVAFAYKGLLGDNTEMYLQFIVKQCCSDNEANDDLKQMAENTLFMLTSSVKDLDVTLWKLLLECLMSAEYAMANAIVLRCLTHLSARQVSRDRCETAFVRCLALMALPLDQFRGNLIVNFLRNIRIWDDSERYKLVWDTRLPSLAKYLVQNYDTFNAQQWETLVFDFLSSIIDAIKEPSFEESLVKCIQDQLPLYTPRPSDVDANAKNAEKTFLLKCLSIVSCHLSNDELIANVVDTILHSVKLTDINELQSCAQAIGIAARRNLKLILDKLYVIRKDVLLKKNNKFFNFGFMKGQRGETELERIRYVLLASYAEICNEARADLLLPMIQSEILDFVLLELANCKEFAIRRVCLKAVGCIADAMHPHRNTLHIHLQDKEKVLALVSSQIQLHNGAEYIELFPITIPVLTALVRLPNVLESHQRLRLLKLCFDNVFNASAIYCKLDDSHHSDVKLAPHVVASFAKVNLFVHELLVQSTSPATLDEIVTLLEPWLCRKKLEHRLPALEALRTSLQTYVDHMKFAYEGPSAFNQTGVMVARVAPRCTDPHKRMRKVAVECICLTLCISARYEGHMRDHDQLIENSLAHVQEHIDTEEPKLMFTLVTDLANIMSTNIPKYQLGHFVDALIDGLLDVEASSSAGVAVLLKSVITYKGNELQPFVKPLIEKLLLTFDRIANKRAQNTTLLTVLSFANHHLKPVLNVILQQPLPYTEAVCSFWSVLASDGVLVVEVIEKLKKILKAGCLYEEEKNAESMRIALLKPLQALCALREVLQSKETHETCKKQFPDLFAVLYVALASYISTVPPVMMSPSSEEKKGITVLNRNAFKMAPFAICLETFKLFLNNAEACSASHVLRQCDGKMDAFLALVPQLTEQVFIMFPQSLTWLIACLGPNIRSECEPQRIAVTAILAYLLKYLAHGESMLAENVLDLLLDVHADTSCTVRMLSLRSLGFAAEYLNSDLVSRNSQNILNALMQGLDYNHSSESTVALDAMLSFSKLLKLNVPSGLTQTQITASVRIKPLLQHDAAEIREAAIVLFGDLAASLGQEVAFKEQIHGNLITLLLHLEDEDSNVIKACKSTLRKIGPYIESSKVNVLIQDHLLDDAHLHFAQFLSQFVKAMADCMQEYFPQFILTTFAFFKSSWTAIRANSALAAGLIYAQTAPEYRSSVSLDTLCYRLLQLVKDSDPDVRAHAAEALSYVFTT